MASNDKEKIYAIGGNDFESYHNSIEVYEKSSKTWTLLSEMSTPRSRFAATIYNKYSSDK